jgi:hypothetical protein
MHLLTNISIREDNAPLIPVHACSFHKTDLLIEKNLLAFHPQKVQVMNLVLHLTNRLSK